MSLYTVVDVLRMIDEQDLGSSRSALERSTKEINDFLRGIQGYIGARLGLLIGSSYPEAKREIEEKINIHQNRICIILNTTDPIEMHNLLKSTGWKTHLSLEKWTESEDERLAALAAENYLIGPLNDKLYKIEGLFKKFVSQGGKLGQA